MNYIYVGYPCDLNIGIGKTVSAVASIVDQWIENPDKKIFSNIKLNSIDYIELTPENLSEALETKNAIVLMDELHAIVHKNHKVHEGCTKHSVTGLCYRLSEFYRQVRKRDIDTHNTCQTFSDAPFQYRQLMNVQVLCEKYHIDEVNRLKKCRPTRENGDRCPMDHRHVIKQTWYPSSIHDQPYYLDPEPYYGCYDSYEIVDGWVSYA